MWRASLGGEATQASMLQEVLQWVDILNKQSPNIAQPSKAPLQRVNLPTARDVIKFQLDVMAHSTTMTAQDINKWGQMTRQKTAQACQDTAMMCLAFGFLPPLRLGCIRSCLHPDHVEQGCLDTECR